MIWNVDAGTPVSWPDPRLPRAGHPALRLGHRQPHLRPSERHGEEARPSRDRPLHLDGGGHDRARQPRHPERLDLPVRRVAPVVARRGHVHLSYRPAGQDRVRRMALREQRHPAGRRDRSRRGHRRRHGRVGTDTPYAIVSGNPGTITRYRFEPAQIERLLACAWWDLPDMRINAMLPLLASHDVDALLAHVEGLREAERRG